MKKYLYLFAMCLAVMGCGHKNQENSLAEYPVVLNNENGAPGKRVESVSVVDFEVNESWMYTDYSSWLTKTNDRWVMVNPNMGSVTAYPDGIIHERGNDMMLMYDHKGKMTSQRHLSGRGPGEVVSIENLFSVGDKVYIYDSSEEKLVGFDKEGKHISTFRNEGSDEAVFKIGSEYIGLNPRGEYYVNVYDQKGNLKGSHFESEAFFRGLSLSNGSLPAYYIHKDCVRFMRSCDYTIYSYSNDTVIPAFEFVTDNAIPESLHSTEQLFTAGGQSLHYVNAVQFMAEVMKGGYDHGFSDLSETENYLYFQYYSKGTRICLFDKRDGSLYKQSSTYLDYYDETDYSVKTADDAWNYLFSAANPRYSDDDCIYFVLRVESFNILKNIPVGADKRLAAFISDGQQYIAGNSLSEGDIFFIRMDFK